MEEIWKPIEGHPQYLISPDGRIKSLRLNRLLSMECKTSDYVMTYLDNMSWLLHRLLAITFIPNPDNKPYVNHIDGNKRNNDLSNLEWCTPSENVIHAFRTGLNKGSGKPKKQNTLKKVNTMLEDDTIEHLTKEAKEKSISVSAVIRQKVEASYNLKERLKKIINLTDPEFGTGNN